tara:strand:- start:243 stop:461 length:219 start_codon:yes stop_codon:yes gene_type:complete
VPLIHGFPFEAGYTTGEVRAITGHIMTQMIEKYLREALKKALGESRNRQIDRRQREQRLIKCQLKVLSQSKK